MNSKQVIKALKECSKHKECAYCDLIYECSDKRQLCKLVLNVVREYEDNACNFNRYYNFCGYKL